MSIVTAVAVVTVIGLLGAAILVVAAHFMHVEEDPRVGEVLGVMRELASERMTMLVVTHEMSFARDVADRVVFMEDGLIVEEGPPEQVFHSANPRTRQFVGEN